MQLALLSTVATSTAAMTAVSRPSPSPSAVSGPHRRVWVEECKALRRAIRRIQSTAAEGCVAHLPVGDPKASASLSATSLLPSLSRSSLSSPPSPRTSPTPLLHPASSESVAFLSSHLLSPSSSSSPPSLAALQERYSRQKALIRESAALAIQRAYRGWRSRRLHSTSQQRERKMTARAHLERRSMDAVAAQVTEAATAEVTGGEMDASDGAATEEASAASSPSARLDSILDALLNQRLCDARMAAAVEEWGRVELEKERALLKALLMRESERRRERRTAGEDPAVDAEMRRVFGPLFAHYRHLQSLLQSRAHSLRAKVPLFHSPDSANGLRAGGACAPSASAFTRVNASSPSPSPSPVSPPSFSSLAGEKRSLQLALGEFTRAFQASHGRSISSAEDIAPVKAEWARYKYLKRALQEGGQKADVQRVMEERLSRKRPFADLTGHSTPQPDSARSLCSPASFASSASLVSPTSSRHSRSSSHAAAFSPPSFAPQSTSPTSKASPARYPPSPPSASYQTTAPSTPLSAATPTSPPSPLSASALPPVSALSGPAGFHSGGAGAPVAALGPYSSPPYLAPALLLSPSVSALSHPLAALRLSSTLPSSSMAFSGLNISPSHALTPSGSLGLPHHSAFFPFHSDHPLHTTLLPTMNLAWC